MVGNEAALWTTTRKDSDKMHLIDLGLEIGTQPAETHIIGSALHEPIDIGEVANGLCKYWSKARYLVIDDSGEVKKDDYLCFNVFAVSELEAKQKITNYFKELNFEAENNGMDIELELLDVFLKDASSRSDLL